MPKPKRVNKTKEQLEAEMKHLQKINREKSLVKLMYPLIQNQKSIYDAQTVLQALSGFIKFEMDKKLLTYIVKDLPIDLSKEEASEIKTAMLALLGLLELENAKDTSELLKRFGDTLAQFSAKKFMEKPMSEITITDIIAE